MRKTSASDYNSPEKVYISVYAICMYIVYIWAILQRPTGYTYEVGQMASKISVTGQQLSINRLASL